ncbi:MAG: YggT family protein [bacterium JZ-2024 1]
MMNILVTVIHLYILVIVIRILMTWVPPLTGTVVYEFLQDLTDPYLNIFRRIIPPVGMIDFSPIVAILALYALIALLQSGVRL